MTGTTRTGVLWRTAARMATMALQGMRPGWDAAAAAALASRLVGGVGLPAVLRAGGDAGSEGGRAVLVRSLHASMRSSCPSCPLLAHSRPRSSRLYGRILSPPRSSAPSTVWRAAVRWLEKWPQNKKNNIVLCVPPSQVWRHCNSAIWALQDAEFQTNSFRRLRNRPAREEFRTVESFIFVAFIEIY